MARATNSPASRKRRKKVLKYAKGYFGNKSRLFRYANDQCGVNIVVENTADADWGGVIKE